MANLLNWLGKKVHDVEQGVGNFVHGAEQNVGHAVQGVQQGVQQNVNRGVQQVQQAVQHLPAPSTPNFHISVPVISPLQDVLHQIQGLQRVPQVQQATQNFNNKVVQPAVNLGGQAITAAEATNPVTQPAFLARQVYNKLGLPQLAPPNTLQFLPQEQLRAGLALTGKKEFTPSTPGQKALLGNETVKDYRGSGQDTASLVGLKHLPAPVATGIGLALTGAGLTPAGAEGKGAAKGAEALAKSKAAEYAKNPDSFVGKTGQFKASIQKELNDILAGKQATPGAAPAAPAATRVPTAPRSVPTIAPKPDIKVPFSQLKWLESQGLAGAEAAQSTVARQTTHDIFGAQSEAKIPTVLKLTKGPESHNFQLALRGEAEPVNAKVTQAIKEWKAFTPEAHSTAIGAGIKVGNRGPNYFPQATKGIFKNDNTYNRVVQHLVDSGQTKDEATAVNLLDQMRKQPSTSKSDYFKSRTLDTGLLHNDAAAVARDYISQAAKNIADATHYGPRGEKINALIARIGAEGGDAQKAQAIMKNIISPETSNSLGAKAIRVARTAEAASKLGTAVISHAGQPALLDTARVGPGATAKAYLTRFSKTSRQHVEDTGINYQVEKQRQLEQTTGKLTSKITAPLLTTMQKYNRGVSANAGRIKAQQLIKKAAAGDAKATEFLRTKLGIKGEIGKDLTPEQIVQAGRNEAVATHFSNNPAELPHFMKGEGGKMVMQFRGAYGAKVTGLIVNEFLKDARRGNFAPLIRFAILAPVVGTGIYAGKQAVNNAVDDIFTGGKNQQALLPPNILEAANKAGAFGVPGMIAEGFKYTKNQTTGKIDKGKLVEASAGAVAPLLGEATKTIGNIGEGLNGNWKPLAHQELANIPIVGKGLANNLTPYTGTKAPNKPGGLTPIAHAASVLGLAEQVAQNKLDRSKDINKDLKAADYLTKDQQNFLKLTPDQQKAYIQAHPDEAYLARSADEKRAAEQIIKGVHPSLPNGLDAQSVKTLTNYDRLSQTGKDKFKDSPRNTYDLALANYNKDLLDGKLTQEEQYTKQQALGKQKIETGYSQEVVQLYGFSKTKLDDFFTKNPDKTGLFGQVQDLSKKLADAGFTATDKFAKGLAKASRGRRGGTRVARTKIPSFKIAKISAPKGIIVKKLAYKAPKTTKLSVSKIPKIV